MRVAVALLSFSLVSPAAAAPRLDVDLTSALPSPTVDGSGFRPFDGTVLLPKKRFAAGFVLEGSGASVRPLLEVCGPEVTLSVRFGGPGSRPPRLPRPRGLPGR